MKTVYVELSLMPFGTVIMPEHERNHKFEHVYLALFDFDVRVPLP